MNDVWLFQDYTKKTPPSLSLRYFLDLLDRRNTGFISVIFRRNELPGKRETGN